ncbi:unnamed protein product [Lactuca virosa]|uniref:Uncharacterized protein n=1 Tax=Lactuca virosa TaxID=75947 RepID=A0AAU9LF32_9ASTR|nr:unnamed protein product [Lactuca virosa]
MASIFATSRFGVDKLKGYNIKIHCYYYNYYMRIKYPNNFDHQNTCIHTHFPKCKSTLRRKLKKRRLCSGLRFDC